MSWIVAIVALGAAASLLGTARLAARHGWRWQTRHTHLASSGGPYRGFVCETLSRRRIPAVVLLASVASPIWGLLILLLFAPAGLLLALMLLGNGGFLGASVALPLVAVCLHGFAVATGLLAAPAALLRRRPLRVASSVALHHALVLGVFTAVALLAGGPAMLGGVAILALVGLGLARLLGAASIAASPAADRLL